MADRYCTNCGAQLGDEARFCPSCGRPVHETAAVPTPEADVPVPPPPGQQTGGTPNYAPTSAAPRQRSTVSKLLIGCAGLFVLGILFVGCLAIVGSGDGGEATALRETEPLPLARRNKKIGRPNRSPRPSRSPSRSPNRSQYPSPAMPARQRTSSI